MSKELKALEKIKDLLFYEMDEKNFKTECNIIETALKEKEQQDSVFKTLKEVIAFNKKLLDFEIKDDGNIQSIIGAVSIKIQRDIENKERELLRKWVLETCFPKELKALEIIKIVMPNLTLLGSCKTFKRYKEKSGDAITKEEYDLLKEVLSSER